MPELTWVISGEGRTVFFGGDSLKIPELEGIAARVPPIDVALMPVNGLRAVGHQVVMNAEEAADVVAMLHPRVAVPMHYTFKGSWFSDTFILGYDGTPERFVVAVQKAAPDTKTVVLAPGELLVLQGGSAPSP
jgi:L-ascorbate metabolism protein UlaG (beta-lactamase superfamily)